MKSAVPHLEQTLDSFLEYIFKSYHWHKIGKIQSINFTECTCIVQIVHKYKNKDGKQYSYSPLISCPIQLNYGKNGGLLYPINIDDECLVCFNDVSIDDWWVNGNYAIPTNNRVHDINDGIVIPGFFNKSSQNIKNYNNDSVLLWNDNAKIELKNKINIANNNTSIKTILSDLITALNGLKVIDPISGELPITATTLSNLNNVLTKINQLFE